jgi:hypothetical protein
MMRCTTDGADLTALLKNRGTFFDIVVHPGLQSVHLICTSSFYVFRLFQTNLLD